MDIIDRIITVRQDLRLNQGEFATKLGLSQGAVSDFENRKKALIDRNIKLICLTFGVNEDWLRYGKGEMLIEKPEPPPPDSPDQEPIPGLKDLTVTYKGLMDINRKLVLNHAHYLLDSQNAIEKQKNGETAGIGPKDSGETG